MEKRQKYCVLKENFVGLNGKMDGFEMQVLERKEFVGEKRS
ncbi:hypothetical protein [Chryseobacterium indicum]|nr:hypothetical protein [Chryseobacterium sp. PS-8]